MIATAYIVGGGMVTNPVGMAKYFGLISVACAVVAAGTFWKFENEPPLPPSRYVCFGCLFVFVI